MSPDDSVRPAARSRRTSWRILPGSSSVRGSTAVPWKRASVSSTPSASDGSASSVIQAVRIESRPNSVMYQGAPAARIGPAVDALMHPTALDLEDVGEIRVAHELDGDLRGRGAVVDDLHPLVHAAADATTAEHDQVGVALARRRSAAAREVDGVRLLEVERQALHRRAVEPQLPPSDRSGVDD